MPLGIGQAPMGFVGSVQLQTSNSSTPVTLRVTSADLKTTQEITYPEVIDGRIDTTLYQVGPRVTGGSLAFPLVHEGTALAGELPGHTGATCNNNTSTLAAQLWQYAALRDGAGRLVNQLTAHVRYADNCAFSYPGCYVNTMTWTVTQSESVNVTAELFGGANPQYPGGRMPYAGVLDPAFLSPARVVTWNDALVDIYTQAGNEVCGGFQLREFTVTLNNALERIYTLNGVLAVQDIAAKKREISGTIKTMGRIAVLADYAATNDQRFTSQAGIAFGYKLGGLSTVEWATAFYGVIFQMEEMALTNSLFEVTHNWRALGDCNRDFIATAIGVGGQSLLTNAEGIANSALPYPDPSDVSTYGPAGVCGPSIPQPLAPGAGSTCFPDGLLPQQNTLYTGGPNDY